MPRTRTTWKPRTSGNPRGKPSILRRARGRRAALGFLTAQLEREWTPYRAVKVGAEILRIASGEPVRRHWRPPSWRARA